MINISLMSLPNDENNKLVAPEGMHLQIADDGSIISMPSQSQQTNNFEELENGLYKCTICNKEFVKKSYCKQHILAHSKKYKCTMCDSKFSHRNHLNQHMLCHKEKEAKCPVCNKLFTYKFNMVKHLKCHIKYTDKDGNIKYMNII